MAADSNRRVFIPGGVNDLLRLVEDAERLKEHQPALGLELAGFASWREVEDYVNTDEGKSLVSFVRLVGKYGIRTLKSVLGGVLASPEPGCVTISTAHKGKGLEWSSVMLNEDFAISDGEAEGGIVTAERRLFYVAMTRAKHRLFVDGHTLEGYSRAND
jgi:superfamily I DNA/RNA helicase